MIFVSPSRPYLERREKIKWKFLFPYFFFVVAQKGFMKAFKAFIKPFEAPQRIVKRKIDLIFILIQLSAMHGVGKVSLHLFATSQ